MVVVKRTQIAIIVRNLIIGQSGVAQGDVAHVYALVPLQILFNDVRLRDADSGVDQVLQFLATALTAEIILNVDPVGSGIRVGDEVLQQSAVYATVAIAEVGLDDWMWVSTLNHLHQFVIRNTEAEALHFLLTETGFHQLIEHAVTRLVHHLRRHGVASLILVALYLLIDGSIVLIHRDRIAIHGPDVVADLANGIETTGILEYPNHAEGKDQNPEDCSGAFPHFVHYAHGRTSIVMANRIETCSRPASFEHQIPGIDPSKNRPGTLKAP